MRNFWNHLFKFMAYLVTLLAVIVLVALLTKVLIDGWQYFSWDFLTSYPSRRPGRAGIFSALVGSFYLMILVALIAVPLGVSTALFLEEYMPKNRWYNIFQVNIASLAGMPSIVYGLLGLALFVRIFSFERSLLSAALTLSLLILPVIIIASQGAIRAVPGSLREAAFALGARKYQVVLGQVLPAATPGIMTGVILALSRAIGESAPLILLGALAYVAFLPQGIMDSYTVLPVQIFNWASRPQAEFHYLAAAGILTLIMLLLVLNFTAILIRQRYQKFK